ncbi:MAG: A24 family peptidase, partial [Pirellulales bacterium]|nr:A24 family peptidase [Pirellulales bacterium]
KQLLPGLPVGPDLVVAAHLRFLAHAVLLFLMTVATFIDFDEKTIPSWVTDIGALLGLAFAALIPYSQLTHVVRLPNFGVALPAFGVVVDGLFANVVTLLTFASPNAPPTATWSGGALLIGIGCYLLWCFSLMDRRWNTRLRFRRAAWLFAVRLTYGSHFRRMASLAIAGMVAIFLVWRVGGMPWLGMFNALLGMAVGGGIVWIVRIIGQVALKKEAMGFGDVTLMAMIGAFVGWQGCLFIFFIAPFAGLAVGIAQFGFNLKAHIPYGPYLCLATLVVVLGWDRIWKQMYVYFFVPGLIPSVMAICAVMMFVVLWLMQVVKRRLGWAA